MILERDQIQRYLRHILIPEISGPGQKKLLESSVLIYCDDLSNSAIMLYYLTAMGIGSIYCHTQQNADPAPLIENLHALNPDVKVSVSADSKSMDIFLCKKIDLAIILSESDEFHAVSNQLQDIPIIYLAAAGDRGYLRTASRHDAKDAIIKELQSFYSCNSKPTPSIYQKSCTGLLGTLAAIEAVKMLLNIGSLCKQAMRFDLSSYEFTYGEELSVHKAYDVDIKRVDQQLKKARVLIVGNGGLGSPVAYMLAFMGIGSIGLVDFDAVELSNLNRQILHSMDRIGMSKVKSAKEFLQKLYPEIEMNTYEQRFSKHNALELIKDYDVIIDGLDNLPTRYVLNDACYALKKPLIEAGVLGFNGLTTAILPDAGPCYRCTFPDTDGKNTTPS